MGFHSWSNSVEILTLSSIPCRALTTSTFRLMQHSVVWSADSCDHCQSRSHDIWLCEWLSFLTVPVPSLPIPPLLFSSVQLTSDVSVLSSYRCLHKISGVAS